MVTDNSPPAARSERARSERAQPGSKGDRRRQEIIEHAIALFATRGVGASLREIADEIGITHAALRYYFASRDQLLVEIYRAHEDTVTPDEAPGQESAVESMERSADRNASIPGLVALYATLTTDALQHEHHPVTREFIQERFRRVRAELAEKVRDAQSAGLIAPGLDADDVAALVVAASDGLQLQWLLDPDRVDTRRSLAVLEQLLQPKGSA